MIPSQSLLRPHGREGVPFTNQKRLAFEVALTIPPPRSAPDSRNLRGATNDREPPGRSFTPGELDALVRACREDRTRAGVRDAAIFAVLYIGGMRRSELANLTPSDYTPDPPTIRVHRVKGGKQRSLPLTEGAAAAVSDWLRARGEFPGKLFVPISQKGEIAGDGMTTHAIYKVLAKRARAAGVADLSPHDFRRTLIVMCTNCGHENIVGRG